MKQNITKIPDFDDLIFETRNKDYGAYQLRKKYNSALMTGIIAALFLAGIAVLIPFVSGKPDDRVLAGGTRYIKMEMDRLEPPREEISISPAPPPPESKEIQKIVEYVTPEIVDTIIPIDETPEATDEILAHAGDNPVKNPESGFGDEILDGDGGMATDEPFFLVEVMPSFMGGDLMKFREWVKKRTNYPREAIDSKINGTVILSFIVEKDGSVSNVDIVKRVHPILDNEAVMVISESPKWKPGLQRGQPVRVIFTVPISFSSY
jgi:periplasmic protein TonB